MEDRAQIIEDVAGSIRARKSDEAIRRLFRVAPGGEGREFVQEIAAALKTENRRVIQLDLPAYDAYLRGSLVDHTWEDTALQESVAQALTKLPAIPGRPA